MRNGRLLDFFNKVQVVTTLVQNICLDSENVRPPGRNPLPCVYWYICTTTAGRIPKPSVGPSTPRDLELEGNRNVTKSETNPGNAKERNKGGMNTGYTLLCLHSQT